MVIEGNSPGTFFSGVRMDVRMDGRMDVSRVVDRDRIHAREQKILLSSEKAIMNGKRKT